MEITRHPDIEKDIKKLNKKYRTPDESLEAWERLFCAKGLNETPAIERCNKFPRYEIYKARIIPLGEKCGKSCGYRLMFYLKNDQLCILLFYSRHGAYKSEQELIDITKHRISTMTK